MRDYEIVYIFRSSLTSEEIGEKLERHHAIITADDPGEVAASVHWGKRQLAYPIRKQRNGYYVVAQFTSAPDPLRELERVLKLEDDILRYLIVIAEQPLPVPEAAPPAPETEEPVADEAGADAEAPKAEEEAEGEAEEEAEGADAEAGSEGAAEEDAEGPADEAAGTAEAEEAESVADTAEDEAGDAPDDAVSDAEAEAETDAEAEACGRSRDGAGRCGRGRRGTGRVRRREGGIDGLSKGVPVL